VVSSFPVLGGWKLNLHPARGVDNCHRQAQPQAAGIG
jgi:hypothetical protein